MAGRRVLFTVEAGVESTVRHQGDAVVGLAPFQPRLHCWCDVDQDVLVRICLGDGDARNNCVSQSRGETVGDGALRPVAIHVVHIEAACCSCGIDIDFQCGLADAGSSRYRCQIESDVADLGRSINVEQGIGAVVGGRIRAVSVGVLAGGDLGLAGYG